MMDTSDVDANAGMMTASQQPALNVGMTLREARERMGMSVDDVAERIKFAPRQVEALESNDFAHLPQATFLRGFVRSYARVLQLDEAALLAALPVIGQPAQAVVKAGSAGVPFPATQALQRINVLWLGGALGALLLIGLFVSWHESAPKAKPDSLVMETVPLPAADVVVASAVVSAVQPAEPVAATAKVAEPSRPAEQAKSSLHVAVQNTASVVTPPVATTKPVVPLEQLKRRPLHFVFSADTWAEVIDVNGAVLLSKTNPRGSEQWIGGPRRAPYDISIAHPANVKLYYKGKEIDLSPYAAMETAHLKVE